MIEELKPYESYRDGAVGLPPLPAHWDVRRTKSLLREIDRRTKTGTERLLSLRMNIGLVDHHAMGGKLIPPSSLVGYKHVLPGELVMNRMRAAVGLFGAASSEGLVSPDYAIFNVRPELKVEYAVSLFKTPTMTSLFRLESRGLGTGESGFLRLYSDRFGVLPMPLPRPEEQAAIVRFLEHANRRIDQFIRTKKKLIALLNEQKQAIIHRAVTCGLDPNARLKDSGVPWLGQVPAHWYVTRLKFEASHIIDCLHATPPYRADGTFPAIRTADVEPGRLRLEQVRRLAEADFVRWTQRLEPTAGDILYTREGERFGLAALVPAGVRICISQRMMVFRIRSSQHSAYIMWQLNCPHVYQQASEHIIGSTSPHVNVEQIRNYLLVLPPRTEQQQIVDHIDAELAAIAPALLRAEKEIALAREYRTRLVTDVVTGQFDVRAAAASLSDPEPDAAPAEPSNDEEEDIDDSEAA